uniref:CAP-ZIP_m domain-containing protein n=1 Tax=Steinernema glaseri TaxID=37863 RepID=A0A1I7ZT69_9BILA
MKSVVAPTVPVPSTKAPMRVPEQILPTSVPHRASETTNVKPKEAVPSMPSRTEPPHKAAPVARRVPGSSSIFDNSDSDSDLFASIAKKPPSLKPKSSIIESANSTAGSSSARVDSALNKRGPPSATASQSLAKPSRSVFDDSSDSDDDLFGSGAQNMKFPFSFNRKKSATPESTSSNSSSQKSEQKSSSAAGDSAAALGSGESAKTIVQPRTKTVIDPLTTTTASQLAEPSEKRIVDQTDSKVPSVSTDLEATEKTAVQETDSKVPSVSTDLEATEQTTIQEKPIREEKPASESNQTEPQTMSSKAAPNMKLKTKANDLFAAKLSAALGQGPKLRPPQPKPTKDPSEEQKESETVKVENNPKLPPPEMNTVVTTTDVTSILKSRPKGPAHRRPKSMIRPMEDLKDGLDASVISNGAHQNGKVEQTNGEKREDEPKNSAESVKSEEQKISQEPQKTEEPKAHILEKEPNMLETPHKREHHSSALPEPKATTSIKPQPPSSALFDDSDEDLFASSKTTRKAPEDKPKTAAPKTTVPIPKAQPLPEKKTTTVVPVPKTSTDKKPGLFDDSDSDSDLFK